ncbi:DNA polymerase III subunit beta [Clostridium sp. OM05-6BH]|uniref:DNA polymerase III subunit beta n=1 Tax=unclassified Clostridium TaxID=2614128 RepID=UPI000E46953D|nr:MULTISPECIES: DNA polymerase III subunit beta [unclassified Clostridium]RHV12249.1 DNA polymerase III subunit beta [Clostridium sp. OM05-9BH]RHV17876.1 DNA polymerase III subunit beta [Clostridium sp. OM05-6BH]
MHIICDKSKLIEGMNIVMKAIPGKTTMMILECVVIEVKDNQIKLIANDLQLGIETLIDGEIKQEGSVAVGAKVFFEIIRKLPSDNVSITVDEDYHMNISCGKAKFNIMAKATDEFPYLPNIVKDKNVNISQFTLKDIIRQTVFSISDNENAKVMTGELFEIHDSELKVVSLDGHRISIRKVKLNRSYDDVSVIIPGKTLIEISKIINGGMDDEVSIFFTDKHVLFEFEDTIVLSRLIEGEYYKIDKMLSTDYETKVTVNKRKMLECIDRSTLLLKESDKKPVIIDVQDDYMKFAMNSAIGSMDEDIDASKEGKDILIGFNPRFLMDALRVIDEDEITMYMINPKAPCFIRDQEETYIYLILPVNFNV